MTDAHTHVECYPPDEQSGVVEEIDRLEIMSLGVSTDPADYRRLAQFAARSPWIVRSFGIHPWYAPDYVDNLKGLDEFTDDAPMIGEVGLDRLFITDEHQWKAQREVFAYFLQKANDQDKIVNVHAAGAVEEVLELLDEYETRRALIHWFVGSEDLVREATARGFYVSVGYAISVDAHVQTVARSAPADYLLTESDNPFAYQEFTGVRGMPALVADVVDLLAQERGDAPDQLRTQLASNVVRLFDGDERLGEAISLLSGQGADHGRIDIRDGSRT